MSFGKKSFIDSTSKKVWMVARPNLILSRMRVPLFDDDYSFVVNFDNPTHYPSFSSLTGGISQFILLQFYYWF